MSDERLPDLYLEALALDESDRRELVERLRGEDPALAAELANMLAGATSVDSPIDRLPPLVRGTGNGGVTMPERVGPFRLLRELGRGGMGRVFLAEQETPDYRRTVALKLIDRPAGNDEAVRRFRDEVRILAALEHPGIVRFLHGGRAPEGIWFLALEYVEGDDLVTHAESAALDVDARVRLVVAVAEAVAFAHARGVIHRDIKPANVLVGRDGRPRLLDFGISKLLDDEGGAIHTTTHFAARPLTPAYASPEQLEGREVTALSDVYSIGVVLYELLAGQRPATTTDPITREPLPPSRAARQDSSSSRGERSDARLRGTRRRRISRDLDAICLRALRRDPAERYASAEALHADLCRYLDGEPVEARRRRGPGRLSAELRRSPLRAAAVALLLLGGAALGLRSLRPAQPAASAPAVRSELFPFDPINPPLAEESERRFAEKPDDVVAGAALAIRLAMDDRADEAWIVIARMREIPGAEHDPLIDYSAAVVSGFADEFQRSLVFLGRSLDDAVAQGRTDLIGTIRGSRGRTLDRLGHRDAAFAELEQARIDLERTADHRPLYRALVGLAGLHYERGEVDRCEAMYREAIRIAAAGGFEPLIAHTGLAEVNLLRGRPDLAEPLARGPIEQLRKHPSPHRPADALIRLAQIVRDLGRIDEATAHLEDALSLVGPTRSPRSFAEGLFTRSRFDLEAGRLDRIDATVAALEALAVEDLSRRPIAFARSLAAQKAALGGDLATASAAFAEARRLHLAEGYRDYAALSDLGLAEAEARDGDPERALRILDEALAGFDEAASILPRFFAETIRARLDAEAGRPADARRRLHDLGEGLADSPSRSRRIAFLAAEGAVAASEGRASEATAALRRALEVASASGRKVDELALRIDLARLDGGAAGSAALLEAERESAALGLHALAARARRARESGAS